MKPSVYVAAAAAARERVWSAGGSVFLSLVRASAQRDIFSAVKQRACPRGWVFTPPATPRDIFIAVSRGLFVLNSPPSCIGLRSLASGRRRGRGRRRRRRRGRRRGAEQTNQSYRDDRRKAGVNAEQAESVGSPLDWQEHGLGGRGAGARIGALSPA